MHIHHDHVFGCGHDHSHEHAHTHEHTHDGVAHTHEHHHEHSHDHEHPHSHDHLHDHGHEHHHDHGHSHECGGNCGGCQSQCQHTPMEELIMKIADECAPFKNAQEIYEERVKKEIADWNQEDIEMGFQLHMLSHTDAKLMEGLAPYIVSIHGKFYEMTEIPGMPGQYEDLAFPYAEAFEYLTKGGYDGYINSEYEGQRNQQDRGMEFLANEVEEVRRHHEMMARLSGEGENIVKNLY